MPFAVARDGTRLYFEECGAGEPLLLVHGKDRWIRSLVKSKPRHGTTCHCVLCSPWFFDEDDRLKQQARHESPRVGTRTQLFRGRVSGDLL